MLVMPIIDATNPRRLANYSELAAYTFPKMIKIQNQTVS